MKSMTVIDFIEKYHEFFAVLTLLTVVLFFVTVIAICERSR